MMHKLKINQLKKDIENLQFNVLNDEDLMLKEEIMVALREAWYYIEVVNQLLDINICLG